MIEISRLYCAAPSPAEALRYGPPGGSGPAAFDPAHRKPVVVFNCTRRCNLACAHCYSASSDQAADDELTTAEASAMLEDLAAFGVPVVLFSGGEPLLRPDVFDLVALTARLGMRPVVSTNGTLIDRAAADRLAAAGAAYVGVSLDGTAAVNDAFRGRDGAFAQALAGIGNARDAGMKVGLRFTITRGNAGEIPAMFSLLRDENIPRACFYHLVAVGRATGLDGEVLGHRATRRVVDLIIDKTAELYSQGLVKEILTVDNHADGPYLYLRMLREGDRRAGDALALLERSGGNASGSGIGCVRWDGSVHPDQFWPERLLGNVRRRPFSQIWTDQTDELLSSLRDRRRYLRGRCAGCRFLAACGGNMRARAEAATGDLWAPDPACYLTDGEIAPDPEQA